MGQTHQREAAIFDALLELPPEQRVAHLARACGDDTALRRRVEALLKAGDSSCCYLDSPAAVVAIGPTNPLPSSFEKTGDRIGRYKLLQQIGEGGCGVVYMAEQEEPVSRRVALKVIKLGLDTKSVIARFEAERQALAMMDHPNIAKVLDAGATETGRPYFVMELVRGLKITEYCDEARLSTHARLDLFIQVCQAIQHAHQKGIIHRDIKPSNILVTINDGVPVPKVIDFGIAKATGGLKLTNKTLFTAFEQFIGTPAYMSPEQAVLTSLDIDTRSDIYALGVLLYELLTGNTPFDAKELLAIGLDEMRRTIREQEPPRPSTRLSTLAQYELSTTAHSRGIEAPKLVSELRGDLDWIVMKALEKDRARRYETANDLALDIQRYLNNEPVVACPPSRLYRFQKTVRRNRLAFAAASAVATALVLGVIVSAWQAQRAKAERDSAEAVLKFFQEKVLAAGRPEGQEGGLGKDVTLRQAMDAAESQITASFQNRPLVEAAIRHTLGESYSYLGEPVLAIQQKERALALRQQYLGLEHPDTFESLSTLGREYAEFGNVEQAYPLLENALKLRKMRLGPTHPDTIGSMSDLVILHFRAQKPEQAVALGEEALELSKAKLGPKHPRTLRLLNDLAVAYLHSLKSEKAIPLLEELFKLRKAGWPEHPDTIEAMFDLAVAFYEAREGDRAVPLFEKAFALAKAKLGPGHPKTLRIVNGLTTTYLETGKIDQALPLLEEAFKLQEARLGADHPETLRSMANIAECFVFAKNYLEAETWSRNLLTRIRQRDGPPSAIVAIALASLGQKFVKRKEWAKAEPVLRECLAIQEKIWPEEWGTFNVRSMLGGALLGQHKLAAAQPLVVAGYYGLKQRRETHVGHVEDALPEAMDRLEELYELCPDQPEATAWKAEIERARRVSDPGAIRRWVILGPIAVTDRHRGASGLEMEHLSNQAKLRPQPGDKVSVGGRDFVWRECPLRDYAINFNELLGEERERSVVYAVCYVQVPAPRKGLVIKIGSDAEARLYLNGQKIYDNWRVRSLRLDEDTISDVELQAGLNVVVFKVISGAWNWRGSLRFADMEDQPVQGITITLVPN